MGTILETLLSGLLLSYFLGCVFYVTWKITTRVLEVLDERWERRITKQLKGE